MDRDDSILPLISATKRLLQCARAYRDGSLPMARYDAGQELDVAMENCAAMIHACERVKK